jgi:quercetin dioxygenase-like cupin family protein
VSITPALRGVNRTRLQPASFVGLSCDHREMDVASINELADDRLAKAAAAESGRSSVTVYGRPGARLRQTLMALAAGRVMGEHKSPGDASLHVLRGRVLVRAGDAEIELGPGDLVAVPPQRHDVEALEPSVLLLTVALH